MPRKTVAPPRSRQRAASAKTATPDLPLFALARQVRSWADTLLSVTGSAADIGLSLAQARVKDPKRKQAVAKAGTQLRRWREAAGLTARELSEAVGLGDAKLLEEASTGRILTTAYEEGLSPDEACAPETPQELKDRWGVVLFDFLLRGLLRNRLLHADPNLANFSFRRDGRVVVYDFGCVKEVPLRLARGYRGLCRAALEGRTDDLPAVLKRMGMHRLDGSPLEERLVTPWAALVLELLRPSPPYRFGSDDSVARRMVDAARGSLAEAGDVRFPRDIVFVNRTVLGHFGNLARLRAEGPWRDILGRFTEKE